MKKIKIIRSRPLKEEDEVVDQLPQDTAPETQELTFESNPLEFILQKYPSLNETLVQLLTEDFRDYINGVYIMAPKPTIFKIVLHNNRYFYLTYLGKTYQAKVSGKKYYLTQISELEMATLAIADLLTMGAPPQTAGPEAELTATPEGGEESPAEETPAEETPAGGEEELAESKKQKFKSLLSEALSDDLLELKKLSYDALSPDAKVIAQNLMKKLKISQDQIIPASANNIVIYDDNRKDLIDKTTKLSTYGKPNQPNSGDFKTGKVTITFKPLKTSGEYYELKPQSLGVTTDSYISINQLKKELTTGVKNHPKLGDVQKKFILDLVADKSTLNSNEKQEILSDRKFINEVEKNLGEIIGAIMFAKEVNGAEVLFPAVGNYPLVDYFMKTSDGSTIEVSAKKAKGKGNVIKLPNIEQKVKNAKGKIDPERQEIFDIIRDNNGKVGTLKLVPKYGSKETKDRLKNFLKANPDFPKTYDAAERTALERQILKDVNSQVNFNDLFNKYVQVIYVKYGIDETTLKSYIKVIKEKGFDVYLATKNSTNKDGEKIGFQLK
jgi:hypothetical protein